MLTHAQNASGNNVITDSLWVFIDLLQTNDMYVGILFCTYPQDINIVQDMELFDVHSLEMPFGHL